MTSPAPLEGPGHQGPPAQPQNNHLPAAMANMSIVKPEQQQSPSSQPDSPSGQQQPSYDNHATNRSTSFGGDNKGGDDNGGDNNSGGNNGGDNNAAKNPGGNQQRQPAASVGQPRGATIDHQPGSAAGNVATSPASITDSTPHRRNSRAVVGEGVAQDTTALACGCPRVGRTIAQRNRTILNMNVYVDNSNYERAGVAQAEPGTYYGQQTGAHDATAVVQETDPRYGGNALGGWGGWWACEQPSFLDDIISFEATPSQSEDAVCRGHMMQEVDAEGQPIEGAMYEEFFFLEGNELPDWQHCLVKQVARCKWSVVPWGYPSNGEGCARLQVLEQFTFVVSLFMSSLFFFFFSLSFLSSSFLFPFSPFLLFSLSLLFFSFPSLFSLSLSFLSFYLLLQFVHFISLLLPFFHFTFFHFL